nr:MAG: RNA-dependent RNA polymerase [Hubei sediment noda-like virus 7]
MLLCDTSLFQRIVNLVKSLTLGSVCVYTLRLLWRYRQTIVASLGIGPYPTALDNFLTRFLQRFLINQTRIKYDYHWFPLDNLHEVSKRTAENGHALSGEIRDSARELVTQAVSAAGCVKFEISPASQSYSSDGSCDHQHYAPADLHRSIVAGEPSDRSIIVGIDVDYYLDDPEAYLGLGLPTIFHTFNPITVSGMDADAPFTIKDNVVTYRVSGGSRWAHQVWDWCAYGEFIEAEAQAEGPWETIAAWFGCTRKVYHKVHHARPWLRSPSRVLVWTLPTFSCFTFNWLPSDMHARKLGRVSYSSTARPGWNVLIAQFEGNRQISLGREGEDAHVELLMTDYDILMGLKTPQSVTTRMIDLGYVEGADRALFNQYHAGNSAPQQSVDEIAAPIKKVQVHWPLACEADEPETSARVYGDPIVSDHNLIPMLKRWESASLSIDRRITMHRNEKVPPPFVRNMAVEFVRLVVPVPGAGIPYGVEETATMLSKPSQALSVRQVWETLDVPYQQRIEAFVKNEPVMKAGRVISSYPDARFLLKFSQFTLKFRDEVLHSDGNKHWFCPGMTPPEIANKVMDYVAVTPLPLEGDFSNFDGTVSEWAQRNVMSAVYHRYFVQECQQELQGYTNMLLSKPAKAKRFGFRYEAGVGVKSGSPTTCDLNTVLNAFMQYCAVRMTHRDLTPESAFNMIGLAFGDDSLFDQTYRVAFDKVANHLGMKLKLEKFDPANGVCFLARVFVDPWSTPTSIQDPLRTWRKLHMTTRDPSVPLADAAVDRVEGYLVSDPYTPVTSDYCRAVLKAYAGKTTSNRLNRLSKDKEKPYWVTEGGAWPQLPKDLPQMWAVIEARTGVSRATLEATINDFNQNICAFQPINRELPACEWVDSVLPDGELPRAVDLRLLNDDRTMQQIRAREGSARPSGSGSDESSDSDPAGGVSGPESPKGPDRVPRVPPGDAGKGAKVNPKPAPKTKGGDLPKGGATTRAKPYSRTGTTDARTRTDKERDGGKGVRPNKRQMSPKKSNEKTTK